MDEEITDNWQMLIKSNQIYLRQKRT